MNRFSFLVSSVIAVSLWSLGGCGDNGVKEKETSGTENGTDTDTVGKCAEGTMRCAAGDMAQKCVGGQWFDWDDCGGKGQCCELTQGVASCVETRSTDETETSTGTGTQAGTDSGTGTSTGTQAGTDTHTDTGSDTGTQGGTDSVTGTGTQAGTDSETGTDTGTNPEDCLVTACEADQLCVERECDGDFQLCTNSGDGWKWSTSEVCGMEACPANTCHSSTLYYSYPANCIRYCNLEEAVCEGCTCAPLEETTCTAGGCCVAACDASSGCYTINGTCSDICGTTTLTTERACTGCGPKDADRTCSVGTSATCSATNACETRSCGGVTYRCAYVSGSWQWHMSATSCDDGNPCTTNDTCDASECVGLPLTDGSPCTGGLCRIGACSGSDCFIASAWYTSGNPPAGCQYCDTSKSRTSWSFRDSNYSCSTTNCPPDSCTGTTQWNDYPASCQQYCSGTSVDCNTCTCTATPSACTAGGCCVAACNAATGCYTINGTCSDICGTTTLTTERECTGCGAKDDNRTCSVGTSTTCSATNACETRSCGGVTYRCRKDGDDWNWAGTGCPGGTVCKAGECGPTVDIGAEWTTIPSGSFWMGTPDGSCPADYSGPGGPSCTSELGRGSDEELHYVTLTHAFELMRREVTQGQFAALMLYNPSAFASCGGTCPVERVSWHEALAYANALSAQAGYAACYDCTGTGPSVTCSLKAAYTKPQSCPGYRLPTESEWEYAARGGTLTAFYNGAITNTDCSPLDTNLDAIGWYCGNASNRPHPVAGKAANAWGLYDMSGNVFEWTWDWYQSTYPDGSVASPLVDPVGPSTASKRGNRGGSWSYTANLARSSIRNDYSPGYRYSFLGFRLARSVP